MKLLSRRAYVALLLVLSFVGLAAAPASASYQPNNSLRAGQRPRHGASQWVPRDLQFAAGWDSTNHRAYLQFNFFWPTYPTMEDIEGSQQFLELTANVDCSWARIYVPAGVSPNGEQGYKGAGWFTNIPNVALPYEDTTYGEACTNGNTAGTRGNLGIGVLNIAQLVPNTSYFAKVWLQNPNNLGFAPPNSSVKLTIGTGTVYDSNYPVPPMLGADCSWNDTEIGSWNDATDAGLSRRLEASWCAWQDWSHTVIRDDSGILTTDGVLHGGLSSNHMANSSFELPTASAGPHAGVGTGYATQPSASATRYCADVHPALDGSCFVEFNRGSGYWASVYQDLYYGSWQNPYTAEAAVRCPVGNPGSCSVGVGFRSIRNLNDYDFDWNWVPNDGQWYICRADTNHVNDGAPAGLTTADDSIRFEVINSTGDNLDVDFGFLGGKTQLSDPPPDSLPWGSVPGVDHIDAGLGCTHRF